ncbi:MAG: hypothetical protein AAF824_06475 [Bacteroidota bacterium]
MKYSVLFIISLFAMTGYSQNGQERGTLEPVDSFPMDCGAILKVVELDDNNWSGLADRVEEVFKEGDQNKLSSLDRLFSRMMIYECEPFDDLVTKEEKIRIYQILELNLLLEGNQTRANDFTSAILLLKPEFEVDTSTGAIEPFNQWKTFRKWPYMSVSFFGGINQVFYESMQLYGIENTERQSLNTSSVVRYQTGVGVQLPIWITQKEYAYFSILEWYFEASISSHSYNLKQKLQTSAQEDFLFSELRFRESQLWANVSTGIQWNMLAPSKHHHPKWVPYLALGVGGGYLSGATLNELARINTQIQSIEANDKDILSNRRQINYGITAGGGLKRKWGRNYIALEARYFWILNNISDPVTRYDNKELLYDFGYVSNDFRQHHVMLNLRYTLNLFKPKKLFIDQ